MPADGDLLAGRYRLIRSIGEGGVGIVYEALHEELGKRVAVKLLHPNRARDETVSKRFKREARAIAAIGHRAIVDVYDIGQTDDGTLFLVMELLKGMTLRDLLRKEGVLEISLTAYIMCNVLSALDGAHRTGIVHRDIKPENIFLVRTGQHRPAVKLLDFGVSRFSDPALEDTKLTQSNTIVGTPLYMSPEQAAGQQDVDHLTDIYAAGAVMYECLTGRPPFMADNLLALAAKIQTESPHAPSALRPDIPRELERAVLEAISRDREARFQCASAFYDVLLPVMDAVDRASIPLFEPPSSPPDSATLVEAPALVGEAHVEGGSPKTPGATEDMEPDGDRAPIRDATTPGPVVNAVSLGTVPIRKGRARLLLVAGGLAAAVIGASAALALAPWDRDRRGADEPRGPVEAATSPPSPTAATPPDAPGTDDAAPRAPDASPPARVQVTLEGVPPGATIHVDGQVVGGSRFSLAREDRDVPVEVTAADHQAWRGTVSARESGTTLVRMPPARQARPGSRRVDGAPPAAPRTLPSFGVGP